MSGHALEGLIWPFMAINVDHNADIASQGREQDGWQIWAAARPFLWQSVLAMQASLKNFLCSMAAWLDDQALAKDSV